MSLTRRARRSLRTSSQDDFKRLSLRSRDRHRDASCGSLFRPSGRHRHGSCPLQDGLGAHCGPRRRTTSSDFRSDLGIGTATNLAGAYFARQAGIDMVHVPYKTGSALIADLVEGRIQATFAPAAFTLPMLQDGKLLALAVSARDPMRNPIAAPAALSADIDYEYATWYR